MREMCASVPPAVKNETWREFELLTAKIQKDISPEAVITHDEKIVGRSDAEHQCDVVLRAPIGQLEFTCVIECKDHNEPIGSEVMRAFIGKIADLPTVHQGIMVSAAGFTRDALKLARGHRIKTYKLVDAQNVRWRHEALLPIVFISVNLAGAMNKFVGADGHPRTFYTADGLIVSEDKMYLYDSQTQAYRRVREVLEEMWDLTLDERIPTPEHQVASEPGRFLFYLGENRHEPVLIQAAFTPAITYHYNTISLAMCQGFIDEQESRLVPGSYETTPLDTHVIIHDWPSTTEKAKVPFVPVNFFYLCGFIHRKPRTPRHFTIGRTSGAPDDDAIIL